MWYRLKSSLLIALISTALVLGMKGLSASPAGFVSPAHPALDASDEAALRIAATLAAIAIDEAMRQRQAQGQTDTGTDTPPPARQTNRSHALRMPYYSFASRPSRSRES